MGTRPGEIPRAGELGELAFLNRDAVLTRQDAYDKAEADDRFLTDAVIGDQPDQVPLVGMLGRRAFSDGPIGTADLEEGIEPVVASLNGGPLAGTRNRIINGAMAIDQRNEGTAVSVSNPFAAPFAVDRWKGFASGGFPTGAFSLGRSQATSPAGFHYHLAATCTTADTSIATTDRYYLEQVIEGHNVDDLDWGTAAAKTVTLSFWAFSTLPGTYCVAFIDATGSRSYVAEYTINAASTWERKVITVPGETTGTNWNKANGAGLTLRFSLAAGTTYQGAAGTWHAASYEATANQVNFMGSATDRVFRLTGVQLEEGVTATPFERRSYGQELALCQRYFQILRFVTRFATTSANNLASMVPPVALRAAPTATRTGNAVASTEDGSVVLASSPNGYDTVVYATNSTNLACGGRVTLSAEL